MSSNTKWLPFYVADYLGDTMHLTTLQHGAYILLLMHYWRNGPLPNDDARLAQIARMDLKAWRGISLVLREFFTTNGDGSLHQKRMDWELRRWTEIADKRRDAGRRGAEAKHRPHPTVEKAAERPPSEAGKRMANAKQMPQQMPVDNLANARILPPENLANAKQMPPVCQDFASVHLQPHSNNLTYLGEEMRARAHGEAGEGNNLPVDHLKTLLLESLKTAEATDALKAAAGQQRSHTRDVQVAAVKPRRPLACHLTGEHLALARKQARIGASP